MPKNRRDVPKAERLDAIVNAARVRFTEHGYKGTSIADIARDVGVNSGSIHWYFPTKDDLFAAAMQQIISEAQLFIDSEITSGVGPATTLVTFLTATEPYRGLHVDAHERLAESEAVAAVHDQLHQPLDELLLEAVRDRLSPDTDVALIAEIAHVIFEGLLGSTLRRDRPFEEIIQFVVDMLVATAPQAQRAAATSTRKTARRADSSAPRTDKLMDEFADVLPT